MAYDRAIAIAELTKIQPSAEELILGWISCIHFQIIVPAHSFDFVILPREHDLLVIKARGLFDHELATSIVAFCEHKSPVSSGYLSTMAFTARPTSSTRLPSPPR